MKILQVVPSLAAGFGGPTNAAMLLSSALAKQGQEVTIFTTDADVRGRLKVPLETPVNLNNVTVFYFPVQYLHHYKFSSSLFEALKKETPGFNIIHIHSLFQFSSFAAAYFCKKYHKPYLIRPLGQLDPLLLRRKFVLKKLYLWLVEYKYLAGACAIHCTTEEEKKWCQLLGFGQGSFVMPLGIDLEDYKDLPSYGTFRSKYPQLKNKKVILFLSRINFKKGLDILAKAYIGLANERDDIYLVIAGPDDEGYGNKVKVWLDEAGMLERALFTGMLTGKEKLAAFKDSNIFVLPSYSENFGLAVIEAMACGIPVVISNKVGISPDLQKNNSGCVVECNEASLTDGIRSVLDNPDFAKELSDNGKKMAEEYYDFNKIANRMIALYQKILDA